MTSDKTILIQSLTIALADSCGLSATDLQQKIEMAMNNYSIYHIEDTGVSTSDGSTTKYVMKRFFERGFNQSLSEGTMKQYGYTVKEVCNYCNKEITLLDSDDINRYLMYCKAKGCNDASRDNKRRALSSIFGFMMNKHIITDNPMLEVDKIKVNLKPDNPLTLSEIERIKIACEKRSSKEEISTRDKAMIYFMLSTGVRVTEMCGITLKDVDFQNRSVLIHGKGSKDRYVVYDEATGERLRMYFQSRYDVCFKDNRVVENLDTFMFASADKRHKQLNKSGVEAEFKKIREIAKVPRLHPHLMRVTFATRLAEKNIPINVIAELMGHASITTTQRYIRLTNKKMKQYIESVA